MDKINRVIRFYEAGDADVLKVETAAIEEPKENEVRIEVKALGLNRAEVMFREGQYLEAPVFPSRLGYEASGVVQAVGSKVTSVQVGDQVSTIPSFSMGTYGVYGDTAIVPEHAVAKYPNNLSFEEATAIWMAYLTAYGALISIGHISSESIVLVTAASSSVGLATIQLAKAEGASVIVTTRSADKKAFLLEAGADHVIVTNDENLTDRIDEITDKRGVDLVFDPIGGPNLNQLAKAAAQGATIIEYGALSPEPTPFPLFEALKKGLSFRGYTLFEVTTNAEKLNVAKAYVYEKLEKGLLKPTIDRTFVLDDIVEAHKYMESNKQKGKIVVTT